MTEPSGPEGEGQFQPLDYRSPATPEEMSPARQTTYGCLAAAGAVLLAAPTAGLSLIGLVIFAIYAKRRMRMRRFAAVALICLGVVLLAFGTCTVIVLSQLSSSSFH